MLKILTKYKMVILCVFGILIIISFLMADMLRQLGSAASTGRTMYTIGGEKVSAGELAESALKVQRLNMVIPPEALKQAFGIENQPEQWQLISTAVKSAGLVASPTEGQARAAELAQMRFQAMYSSRTTAPGEWRQRAKADLGLTTDEQLDAKIASFAANLVGREASIGNAETAPMAFAEQKALERMMELYRSSIPASPARQWLQTRQLADRAGITYAFVSIKDGAEASMPEPSSEQISAHFAKYKDFEAGLNGNVFGYRTPQRVSYAFATFNRADLEKLITVDPVEIQKRLMAETPPAADPVKRRRELSTQIRSEQIEALQQSLAGAVRAEIARLTSNLPEVNGRRELPAGFADGPGGLQTVMDVAIKRVNAEKNLNVAMPQFTMVDAMQTKGEFIQQPIIGDSRTLMGRDVVDAASTVFGVAELAQKPEEMGRIRAQVGLPIGQFFQDRMGNISFIVVRAANKAGSPSSADEVKDLVAADLKKLAATAKLKEEMEKFAVIAATLSFNDAVTQLKTVGYLAESRQASVRGTIGVVPPDPQLAGEDFAKEVMSRAMKLDATTPLDASTLQDRTFVVQPQGRTGVALVQITEYQPVSMEEYRQAAEEVKQASAMEQLLGLQVTMFGPRGEIQSPFNAAVLGKRLGVEGLEAEGKK